MHFDAEDPRIFSPGKLWMSEYCRNTKKHKKTQVTEALPKHGSLQLKLTESAPGTSKASVSLLRLVFGWLLGHLKQQRP